MNLQTIIDQLDLNVLTEKKDFLSINSDFGYTSDLLSCVMAGAPHGGIWITLQAHANIIAIAHLLDLAAIIITEGAIPDPAVIAKANEEGITILATPQPTFWAVGKLWELGLRDS